MRSMTKCFLSMLLAAVMILSGSMFAFAAEAEAEGTGAAVNAVTEKTYDDVTKALSEANAGERVQLSADAEAAIVSVPEGVTLDLNGHTLKASYVTCFGNLIDQSTTNEGILDVAEKRFLIQEANQQLPVKSEAGYQFFDVTKFNTIYQEEMSRYGFQPFVEHGSHDMLREGAAATGVTVNVRVSWEQENGKRSQNFVFNDTMVNTFLDSYVQKDGKEGYSKMFTLKLKGAENFEQLTFNATVMSGVGVQSASSPTIIVNKGGNVESDENNQVTQDVTIQDGNASATVSTGTQLDENTKDLKLTVESMDVTTSDVELEDTEEMISVDVHVDGVSKDNTVPIIVTLNEFAPEYMNKGNINLYHVEGGETVKMTRVYSIAEVDEHNEYYYDTLTGTLTMALASFSEVAVAYDTEQKWEGEFDYDWYDAEATELTIANADQLAAFGAIIGGMNGNTRDNFDGKTVKLLADINLADDEEHNNANRIFHPIGYTYKDGDSTVQSFKGTFDGNGHTISNFYQNTWEIKGDYDGTYYKDAMGLFGYVKGGTVKNLTVDNFSSDGEYTPTGVIAAYADGNSTFENIAITNCNPRVYNTGNGGIIGIAGDTRAKNDDHITLKNITVDNSNKISALWGSWDVACGGLVGMYRGNVDGSGNATGDNICFENCHVSAQIDVNNDVCANYQYYAYRYTGMMIGSVRHNKTENGYSYPDMTGISAKGCTVHFGTWNDYYYCELVANSIASYTHDYQFSRLTQVKSINGTTITTLDEKTTTVPTSGRYNYVVVDGDHATENATCYHFVDGEVWTHDKAGTETVDGKTVPVENNQHIYLEFNNLFTGYGWGVTSKGITDYNQDEIKILDRDVANSVEKFEGKEISELANQVPIEIGTIFKAKDQNEVEIKTDKVQVTVSPGDEKSTVDATYTPNEEDWTKGTLTFSGIGTATITITDYYFCTPTTINVTITERVAVEKFEVAFDHDPDTDGNQNNLDKYLYRVGNKNTVKLGSLFEAIDGTNIGTVSVTVDSVDGTAASGTYTSNATWTNGTIQFSGTGVVKVTITDNDYCTPTELYLEVVDAKNATSATSATANNVVLLNSCDFGTISVSNGYTLYGNGFTITARTDVGDTSIGVGFVTLKNGTLDNIQIITPNFSHAVLYNSNISEDANKDSYNSSTQTYGNVRSAVMIDGKSKILNSYIHGGRAAVFARSGNIIIDNTTISGGAAANIHAEVNANLTLKDMTFIQKPYQATVYNTNNTLMGLSVLVMCDGTGYGASITLEGTLRQYAWAHEGYKTYVPTLGQGFVSTALSKTDYIHRITYSDGNTYDSLNLGILYMPAEVGLGMTAPKDPTKALEGGKLIDQRDDMDKKNKEYGVVAVDSAYVYSYKNSNGTDPDVTLEPAFESTKQGFIAPTVTYVDANENRIAETRYDETDGWKSTVVVDVDAGEYEFSFDSVVVEKYGKILEYDVIKKDGTVVDKTSSIILNESSVNEYVLLITDNLKYGADGLLATEEPSVQQYPFTLIATKTSINPPEKVAEPGGTPLLVVKNKDGDWSCAIPALENTEIKYYSKANKTYNTISLNELTPTNTGKQNGTNNYWTYSDANEGYMLKVTCGYIHDTKQVYGMPVVVNNGGNKMYFTISSTNGYVSTSTTSRTVTITYEFTDTNGQTLTFEKTWQFNYAEYKDGTQYSYEKFVKGTLEAASDSCLVEGTLITMADGTKKAVEDLAVGDMIQVFNHVTGDYEAAPLIFNTHSDQIEKQEYNVLTLEFSNDENLKVVASHGLFDTTLMQYVYISEDNYKDFIGHEFYALSADGQTGETVRLEDAFVETEETRIFCPVTYFHMNSFANGFLNTPNIPGDITGLVNYFEYDEDLKYNEEAMQRDIEKYGLYTYDDFKDYISEEAYHSSPAVYLKVAVGKGMITYDEIIDVIEYLLAGSLIQ